MKYEILVPGPLDFTLTYTFEESLTPGQIVTVEFRRQKVLAMVVAPSCREDQKFTGNLKEIEAAHDFIFPPSAQSFLKWVSYYTLIPWGQVFKMACPFKVMDFEKSPKGKKNEVKEAGHAPLTSDQEMAAHSIKEALGTFKPFVLDGVTGSGKTEVYFNACQAAIDKGQKVLVLLPEIGLTSQWLDRFQKAFGFKPHTWHSQKTALQKLEVWKWALSDSPGVIVGARSALFLPFRDLGLVVVDEEHDSSYKQEEQGNYNARDAAVYRASIEKCPIVLASATPSLETILNAQEGKYKYLKLPARFGEAVLPEVQVVSIEKLKANEWLGPELLEALQANLNNNEQSLLFLNRRGYAPLMLCRSCGHRFMCPHCDVGLVYHAHSHKMTCHQCGFSQKSPSGCPKCQAPSDQLALCGPGVERIVESVKEKFPEARVLAITSDLMPTSKALSQAIMEIEEGVWDIIVGTQIMAKGHNFPNLTLVGVIDGDMGLSGSDLRAAERTFQLIHQVAGRAGRFKKGGQVIVQTFMPHHPLMEAIKNGDKEGFYQLELEERKNHDMPPFSRLAGVIISGKKPDEVQTAALTLSRAIPSSTQIKVLGPVPAPLTKLRGKTRWRFLIKASKQGKIQEFAKAWIQSVKLKSAIRVTVDIDPYSFL